MPEDKKSNSNLLYTIVTILASLGVVGGGGGYLVNSGLDSIGSEIAVLKNDVEHIRELQEKTVSDFIQRSVETNKKQWELISDLRDRVTKLEAWKESRED